MKRGLVLGGLSAFLFDVPYVYAVDAVPVADQEPTAYVRICDAMGAGFFQIPGSETCLKISGYVRYEVMAGPDVYTGERKKTWSQNAKASLAFDAYSPTELGVLRTYVGMEGNSTDGVDKGAGLSAATIELNGLQIGASDSQFDTWLGSAGNVLSDDVVPYTGGMTNQVNYTVDLDRGFSAIFGAEQGAVGERSGNHEEIDAHDYAMDGYLPHLVGGLKFERDWGAIATVVGYDSVIEDVAAKLRLDLQLSDTASAFAIAGYQGDPEKPNYFGAWTGTYAAWSGVSVNLSPKATLNSQAAYEDSGKYALAFNVEYEVVPALSITPELNYTSFGSDSSDADDAFAGILSVQRDF